MTKYTPIIWRDGEFEVVYIRDKKCALCDNSPQFDVQLRDGKWLQVCLWHRPKIIEE